MQNGISKEVLKMYRDRYKSGTRVKLVSMNDPYNKLLKPGVTGTVKYVDDIGTIHVSWDCGLHLGLVYNEDSCEAIE